MSIRRTNIDRINEARKSSVPTIGKGKPLDGRGDNGDLTFRRTSDGLKLYIKANGKWHGVKVGESFDDLEKTLDNLKKIVSTIKKSRLPSTYDVNGDFTLDASGDVTFEPADNSSVTIDTNCTQTTSATINGLVIDYDHTGTVQDASTVINRGMFIDLHTDANQGTASSVISNTGIHIDVENVTDGSPLTLTDGVKVEITGGTTGFINGYYSNIPDTANNYDFKAVSSANTSDYFTISVGAEGASKITTTDANSTVGHLTIIPDGDLILDPVSQKTIINATDLLYFDGGTHTCITESSDDVLDIYVGGDKILSIDESVDSGVTSLIGTLKQKEQVAASADTTAYGQIWTKNNAPNELAFTDDAGTDIIGIGKYHYESKIANYSASVVANYIPLVGYVVERTSTANQNEYIAMVAPFNGTLHRVLWRSEEDQDGTLEIDIFESADETEVPGTLTGVKDTTLDRVNDDISVEVNFASMNSGTNALVKGRIYAIRITCPSAPNDTNCTVVFKWDITS